MYVIVNAVIKHQLPFIYMHWSCRRRISTQNTWQWTRSFNVEFDSNGLVFLLFTFQRSIFNSKKKYNNKKIKAFFRVKLLIHLMQVTGSTYCGIVFQTMYTLEVFSVHEKVTFSLIDLTHILLHSFWRTLLSS